MYVFKRFAAYLLILSAIFWLGGCGGTQKATADGATEQHISSAVSGASSQTNGNPSGESPQESRKPEPAETTVNQSTETKETKPVTTVPEQNISGESTKPVLEISGLVLVHDIDPNIVVELRYATTNNFTGQKVYPHEICILRKSTAEKLAKANEELMKQGYCLKVWDAYRPVSVQRIFWDIVKDSRYVANPDNGGSKHNRGTAVDVTLVDMEGNELEMPSGFDDFTGRGSRNNQEISEEAKKNLEVLTKAMVNNGFTTISTEWWHYNDSESDKFGVIDVNPEEFLHGDAPEDNTGLRTDPYAGALKKMANIGDAEQVLLVVADRLDTYRAKAHTYEKVNGLWQPVFESFDVVLGSGGLTRDKKEGDKKSPVGVFPLYRCLGRDENPGTLLEYTKFTADSFWVDDPGSVYYNTYQTGSPQGRWASAEDLYSVGGSYRYFIVVEYNTEKPVPGDGSAIFLHIWKGENSSTAGCTAMSEENILKLISWLEPSKSPVLAQFPRNDLE